MNLNGARGSYGRGLIQRSLTSFFLGEKWGTGLGVKFLLNRRWIESGNSDVFF